MTPKTNQLIAMFVSEKDLKEALSGPELARYFLVQSVHEVDQRHISAREFEEVRRLLRDQFVASMKRELPAIQSQLKDASKSIAENSGQEDSAMRLTGARPLSVFEDRENAISVLTELEYAMRAGGRARETSVFAGITTIRANGRVVFFYAYSRNNGLADSEWVKAQTRDWLHQFAVRNQN